MELKFFPQAIATAERDLLNRDQDLDVAIQALAFIESEIERAIAEDPELKNDQQRKAKRLEMQGDRSYTEARDSVKRAKHKKGLAEIKVNKTRNEFIVKKLEFRREIANLEAIA
ncbi:hypothetical protein V0288_23740 [Pannus brasiliensis CCIBt3594]|uniref:Uncharacterized protein n=1 Tax=Pannus brasiliensis CCIBt3594 TaxID=1427578 RepID=A0AAW9R0S9_9CHRO